MKILKSNKNIFNLINISLNKDIFNTINNNKGNF